MENFQEKIREIIYEECFIIYKTSINIKLSDGNNLNIVLNKNKIDENLNNIFFKNLANKINNYLMLDDKYLIKILNNHFSNNTFKSIDGKYKIKSKKITRDNLEKYINKIKFKTLHYLIKGLNRFKLKNKSKRNCICIFCFCSRIREN